VNAASADRWAELAAAHEAEACTRCRRGPAPTPSVADVVRRMRQEAALRVSEPAGPVDVVADLKHVAAAPADDQVRQAMRIADEVGRVDVRKAASFAAALPVGRAQNGAMLVVIYIWSLRDRPAALEWAQGLPDEASRAVAVQEVTRRLVVAGAREAVALVSALPEGPRRDDALCRVAWHWAKLDRTAALDWVRSLSDRALKARILEAAPD